MASIDPRNVSAPGGPILILSFCHGGGSGAERVLEYLLEAGMESLRDRVSVAAPASSGILETAASLGYEHHPWPSRERSSFREDLLAFLKFRMGCRKARPALIHAWHGRCFEWAALLGWLHGIGVAGTMHDHPRAVGYSRTRHSLMRWGAHRMRGVVCVSEAQIDACKVDRWRAPLTVIRNGIPPGAAPRSIGNGSPLRIGFLGCGQQWKGADMLLDIAAKADPAFVWNLYGPIKPSSSARLRDGNFESPTVRYRGVQPPAAIYAENDLIFHPSTRFDPLPTVLIEAAQAGLPVVASDVGGTGEIVDPDRTGLLFPANDAQAATLALHRLASNPQMQREMSAAAHALYLKRFQASRMVEEYLRFWNHALPHATLD